MHNKRGRFFERIYRELKPIDRIIILGGFLLIVVASTIAKGFPSGFITGLFFGFVFALLGWVRFRRLYDDANEAREEFLPHSHGRRKTFKLSPIATYALLISVIVSVIAVFILGSCLVYSCQNEVLRPQIMFILIGWAIIIQQLFYKERVKGKVAFIVFILLGFLVIFLLGKVFFMW